MTEQLSNYLSLALSLIAVGTVVYGWFTAGGTKALAEVKAVRSEIRDEKNELEEKRQTQGEAIVARFQMVESRLLKIEAEMPHLPDREQTHRLEIAVERLAGRMETLDERLKPVAAIGDRLQEFLLEQARK